MMRFTTKSVILTLTLTASAAFADSFSEMTPDQLQEAAIEAVNGNDRRDLMTIMKEMQAREMHFFRQTRSEICEREPENTGFLATRFGYHGTARQAYFTYLREHAMEAGSCACLMSHMSFDEFLTEKFGFVQADLNAENFQQVIAYQNNRQSDVNSQYRAFSAANCRKN